MTKKKRKSCARTQEGRYDVSVDNRRRNILRMRMQFPPVSVRMISEKLKISTRTVQLDMMYLRSQMSSEYFAKDNRAAIGRAMAESETLAFQFLTEGDSLDIKKFASEKAALYGRALQALQMRDNIMLEAGIIAKVPTKIEASGPNGGPLQVQDLTTMTVEERIAVLTANMGLNNDNPAPKPAKSSKS